MQPTEIINAEVEQQIDCLRKVQTFVQSYTDFFVKALGDLEHKPRIAVSPGTLHFGATDPVAVLQACESYFDIIFTREPSDDQSYNWVSCVGSVKLRIHAGEVINATGTLVRSKDVTH